MSGQLHIEIGKDDRFAYRRQNKTGVKRHKEASFQNIEIYTKYKRESSEKCNIGPLKHDAERNDMYEATAPLVRGKHVEKERAAAGAKNHSASRQGRESKPAW